MPKRSQKSGEETDHRPRGRPLCRTGPSSEPQETDNQESPRSLQTQHKQSVNLKRVDGTRRSCVGFCWVSPNQACWSPSTSMARPKSASFTAAPLDLEASSRFSGWRHSRHANMLILPLVYITDANNANRIACGWTAARFRRSHRAAPSSPDEAQLKWTPLMSPR